VFASLNKTERQTERSHLCIFVLMQYDLEVNCAEQRLEMINIILATVSRRNGHKVHVVDNHGSTSHSPEQRVVILHNKHDAKAKRCSVAQSPALSLITLTHMAVHHLHHLHYHRLHLLLIVQYFILNSRLGSSANPFLHRPFPFLPD